MLESKYLFFMVLATLISFLRFRYTCLAKNQHGQANTSGQVMHKEKYDEWLREEQMKITSEKKRTMLAELDNTVQQQQPKPKGQFVTPQSQKLLQQRVEQQPGYDSFTSEGVRIYFSSLV